MVEQKAAVAMMEIEQSELNRVSEAFGYNLISTSRLTGGYASSNFAAVLRPQSHVRALRVGPSILRTHDKLRQRGVKARGFADPSVPGFMRLGG